MATSLRSVSLLRSGLVALSITSGACTDDAPSLTTTTDTEPGTSTTDAPMTTMPDPDTTGGSTGGESTEGVTTEGVTTTEGGDGCGNGMVDAGEECDGRDLDGADCVSQGFIGGTLFCTEGCTLDTSSCVSAPCGNGEIGGTEECDGPFLGSATCQTEGFDGGELLCAEDCTLDTSSCTNAACGDGAINGTETCDGVELGGEDCVSQGFSGGALGCAPDCAGYDTSGCLPCEDQDIGGAIGPAVAAGNTSGDDDDIDATCSGAGGNDHVIRFTAPANGEYAFDTFGSTYDSTIALYSDCATEISCNDDVFPGNLQSLLGLSMTVGESVLVIVDGFDGSTGDWVLNISEGAVCGNGVVGPGEACDGLDLLGQTCVTQGFDAGLIVCAPDCLSLDLSSCVDFAGDCCAPHDTPGCDDPGCTAAVCGGDGFCCSDLWDSACADAAIVDAACQGVGGSCPA